MKIILMSFLISFIASITYAQILPQKIKIEDKTLTLTQYSILKANLINKYKTQGYFTPNEWQTYVAVLNWEAKAGKLANLKNITKQNIISKFNEAIK